MTDLTGQYLGRYYLTERLGEGGMAVVYKAYDTRLERDVAVKIIRSDNFPANALDEVLKRFEREAKALAKLSHPNIVKVHDYGEHDGSPYLVMEYLPGGTLKKILDKPIPWQDAVRLILPVARGIAYAHQRGILHRDIKPANVLITESGEPMLSDFGIAKLFEADQTTALTGSGMAIGTPEYMAPEQWAGSTSPLSDLYSLGIVLYEMVAGRKPYIADTPGAILIMQVTEPLPGPRKFVAEIPEALEHVLVKALAREPSDRYKDINAFIHALENLQLSAPVIPPPEPKPVEATYQVPATKHKEPVPTEIVTRVRNEPAAEKVVEPEKMEEPPPAKTRPPIKFSRRSVGILIGGIIVVLAVWLGSPLMGKLAPALIATATSTSNVAPTDTITPTETIPPTETITPTASPLPTETVTVMPTPLPTEISDVDPSGNAIPMRLVPAGKFTMGSDADDALAECKKYRNDCQRDWFTNEEPPHEVELDSFYMDTYEVTNILYKACVTAGVCDKPRKTGSYNDSRSENDPVVYVNWNMAKTYCEWRGAELPTEAQWEKAARGTDGRTYPWGEGNNCTKASYSACGVNITRVGSYEDGDSPYGLYDMAGNVWEWVSDWYSETYYAISPPSSPLGPGSGQYRVLRVSAWYYYNNLTRSANRSWYDPANSYSYLGFRCSRSVGMPAMQPTAPQTLTPEPVTDALPTQITDDKGVSMRLVPAGTFTMGVDADIALAECKKYQDNCTQEWFTAPPHEVELDSFYIDTYEVTNLLYKICVTAKICDPPKDTSRYDFSKYENHPVVYVDWYMAKTYCEWRGPSTGSGQAHLPTEAQWEKAARGTDGRIYPWGEWIGCSKANYYGCAGNTTPVGSYKNGVSPYGLYDMAGNVYEWVSSLYQPYPYSATDGRENLTASGSRVLRGGSWYHGYGAANSFTRGGTNPSDANNDTGFRCARDASP